MDINLDSGVSIVSEEKDNTLVIDDRKAMLAQRLSMGTPMTEIADDLGVSVAWVRSHKRDTDVVALVKELQEEAMSAARLTITNASAKAASTLLDLMGEDIKSEVRLSAAKDVLDRLGFKQTEVQQKNINISYSNLSKEELRDSLKDRMRALVEEDEE